MDRSRSEKAPHPEQESSAPFLLKPGILAKRVSYRTRLIQNILGKKVIAGFTPYDLRPGSFTTMALMSANPGRSQMELCAAGGLDKSAIVIILDDLEAKGLAMRGRSKEDRRRNALFLTSLGEEMLSRMAPAAADSEQCIRDTLSPEELDQLFDLLDRAHMALVKSSDFRSSDINLSIDG